MSYFEVVCRRVENTDYVKYDICRGGPVPSGMAGRQVRTYETRSVWCPLSPLLAAPEPHFPGGSNGCGQVTCSVRRAYTTARSVFLQRWAAVYCSSTRTGEYEAAVGRWARGWARGEGGRAAPCAALWSDRDERRRHTGGRGRSAVGTRPCFPCGGGGGSCVGQVIGCILEYMAGTQLCEPTWCVASGDERRGAGCVVSTKLGGGRRGVGERIEDTPRGIRRGLRFHT
ncbi:hypothetical protein C8R44DRAFT_760856 [Mycena epipterygia]|nr:hypothetical protein C8R44DRAFT_760856 [Mycena epipterygia]